MPSKAEKLLERMRRSRAGWKRRDLDALYQGFNFVLNNGRKHDYYIHTDFPVLRDTVKRSRNASEYNVRNAIRLIDKLKELQTTADHAAKGKTQ